MVIEDDSHYLVSLFQFSDEANFSEFYDYCDSSAAILSQYDGFRSAFGYLSTYEMAKYPYVGITELASMDVLYEVIEEKQLAVRLTPPDNISTMTLFATCRTNGYAARRTEHRNHTEDSVVFINPFSRPADERDSPESLELERRNLMLARANHEFKGYKGFSTTIPTAIHNYVALAEFATEKGFLAHMNSKVVKAANQGFEQINTSGYPGVYKLVLAKTDDGYEFDNRLREEV